MIGSAPPTLLYTDAFVEDLAAIDDYIGINNPIRARTFIEEIFQKCQLLAENPHIGIARPELGTGVRSFPHGNYLIFYTLHENGVKILRTAEGHRDLPRLFKDI